jgi:hypothetical protein
MTLTQAPLTKQTVAADTKVGGYQIDGEVLSSIRHASRKTGVEFGYLMAQAAQESAFKVDAKASSSSATGLYQFLDSTWMQMVRDHGAKHGLATEAAAIQRDGRGNLTVADPAMKKQILEMRKDPRISAVLGAEFALGNKAHLENALGHDVGSSELYLAHFLGAQGATRFLQAIERNGNQPAASLMPDAAASNKAVFYDKTTGRARTVREVFNLFSRSIEAKSDTFAALEDGIAAGPRAAKAGAKSLAGGFAMMAQAPRGPLGAPGMGGNVQESANGGALASDGLPTGPLNLDLLTMLALSALETLDATSGEEEQGQAVQPQDQTQPEKSVQSIDLRQQQRAYEATKAEASPLRFSV